MPRTNATAPAATATAASVRCACVILAATNATMIAAVASTPGIPRDRDPRERERERTEESGDAVTSVRLRNGAHATRALARERGDGGRIGRRPRGTTGRRRFQSFQPHGTSGREDADLLAAVRVRFGTNRPPDDRRQVDHRDLEHDEHEDGFPGGDAHSTGQCNHLVQPQRLANTCLTMQPLGCPKLRTPSPTATSWECS